MAGKTDDKAQAEVSQTAADNQHIIKAVDLNKIFRDFWLRPKVHAVKNVSFDVRPGEIYGLLGPNGSGKSTTIKMILGLLHPSSGHLRVLDSEPRDVKTKQRIGYLPEESYLYKYLTSEETLDYYGSLFDMDLRVRRARISDLLDMVGLTHARRRLVSEFSKGMARRIGLAQALINDPDLVILDEPTSGLDPIGCRQVKDLILTLAKRKKTILLSSHLLADVEDVCDRIAILYNGQVQAQGSIKDLLEVRQVYRMMLPDISEEQLNKARAALKDVLGQEPEIDHPHKDLEQFFLEVIERARQVDTSDSGAKPTHGVSGYLSGDAPDKPDNNHQATQSE